MSEPRVLYYAKFKNRQIVVYPSFEMFPKRHKMELWKKEQDSKPKFSGIMSQHTRKKIRKIVECWVTACLYRLDSINKPHKQISKLITFATLTLSSKQFHTDQEIKRLMLNRFLIECKREFKVSNFLWVSEVQKNGNIHFHILFDKLINWRKLRDQWNAIQLDNGYLTEYQQKFQSMSFPQYFQYLQSYSKVSEAKALENFNKGNDANWLDPNSTDIHSLSEIHNPAAYIIKYLSKENEGRLIEGRQWSCSRQLGSIDYHTEIMTNATYEWIRQLADSTNSAEYHAEYFSIFKFPIESKNPLLTGPNSTDLKNHYLSIYSKLYENEQQIKEPTEIHSRPQVDKKSKNQPEQLAIKYPEIPPIWKK